MTAETWLTIPTLDAYQASDHGRIRSLRYLRPRKLKRDTRNDFGYLSFSYRDGYTYKRMYVHRAVCLAFHGLPAEGQIVLHGPLGSSVNTPDNLSWGTHSDNAQDRDRDGTFHRGEDCSSSKLTSDQIILIRQLSADGLTCQQLGRQFNCTDENIRFIIKRKTWTHI